MLNLYFTDYKKFANEIDRTFKEVKKEDEYDDVGIIALYDEAKQILKDLISAGYDVGNIQIESDELDGYVDEFVISVINIDGKDEIWCEPMVRENGYINDESNVTYVFSNCHNEVYDHLFSKDNVYTVSVGDDSNKIEKTDTTDKVCDCSETRCKYSVNGKDVTKEEYLKAKKDFNDKFNETVNGLCDDVCKAMCDSMYGLRRLFYW